MKITTRKAVRLGAVALAATFALAACAPAGAADSATGAVDSTTGLTPEVSTLRYENIPNILNLPELAKALGYLDSVDLERVGVYSGPAQNVQSTVTGQLDVGAGGNGSILQAKVDNLGLTSVVGYVAFSEESAGGIYVLDDSGIESAQDLVGKSATGLNGLPGVVLREYLTRADVDLADVEAIDLPFTNVLEQSLRAGDISAGYFSGLIEESLLDAGGVTPLVTDYELFPEATNCTYFFSDDFIAENPNTVRIFVQAVNRAIEWATTHTRDEVVEVYTEYLRADDRAEDAESFAANWKTTGFNSEKLGTLEASDFDLFLNDLVRTGKVAEGEIDVESVFTNEFAE